MDYVDPNAARTGFTLEELETVWKLYASEVKGKNHNASLIANSSTLSLENEAITIHVENFVQLRQLVELREEIQLFLREKLNNYYIKIDGKVKETKTESNKAYTSHEKFEFMAKINPALLRLKELLQLETGH